MSFNISRESHLKDSWHHSLEEEWVQIEVGDGYDESNSNRILKWNKEKKRLFFKIGVATGVFLLKYEVGKFLLEHAVGFYAYAQYAPQTVWSQYFYANAAHEAAMRILSTPILGFCSTTFATVGIAMILSVAVIKVSVVIYNAYYAREYEEYKIALSISTLVRELIPRIPTPGV